MSVWKVPFTAWLAAVLLVAWTPESRAATPETREILFVGNNLGGTVTLVDVERLEVVGEIDVVPDFGERTAERGLFAALVFRVIGWLAGEKYVDDVAVSPDGTILYVSRGNLADVAAFRIDGGELEWRVPVSGYRADHLALSPDGRRLYVSALTAKRVDVIDTRERKIVGGFPTGARPHGIRLSPDGRRVYAGSLRDGLVTVADTETLEVLRTIDFDEGVRPFAIGPDEKRLYVQLSHLHGFVEFDLAENRKTKTIHLPVAEAARDLEPDDDPFEAAHHGIEISPDGRSLCVAGTVSGYAALVSLPALEVAEVIPVGSEPAWAVNSLDGRYCFVSVRNDDVVSVISYVDRKERARLRVGRYPQRMCAARVPAAAIPHREAGETRP